MDARGTQGHQEVIPDKTLLHDLIEPAGGFEPST